LLEFDNKEKESKQLKLCFKKTTFYKW